VISLNIDEKLAKIVALSGLIQAFGMINSDCSLSLVGKYYRKELKEGYLQTH